MVDIIDAIKAINPNANVVVMGEDINQITWHNNTPVISNEDILAKQTELQTAYDALAYARTRETAYPDIKDFMEAYTEKEIGGDSTKWDAYVIKYNLVRNNNPKP